MPPKNVIILEGISYPREVPMPDGLPEGWIAVESAYSEKSCHYGKTYVRFRSMDGKHRHILGPKQVVELHCKDHGMDFTTVYAEYEKVKKEKIDKRKAEAETRGKMAEERREAMIALFQKNFGEIDGPTVFAFPGWKCRWDFLPESKQCPKTFIAPDGVEFKLVKDVMAKYGAVIEKEGNVPADIAKMVRAGKTNTKAHDLFINGTRKAQECEGSVTLDPSSSDLICSSESKAERAERMQTTGKKRKDTSLRLNFADADDYQAWRPKINLCRSDTSSEIANLKSSLLQRLFKDCEDLMLQVVSDQAHRYGDAISGYYFLRSKDSDTKRPVYQQFRMTSRPPSQMIPMDAFIYWSDRNKRWEIGTMDDKKEAVAFSSSISSVPTGLEWKLLRETFGKEARNPQSSDTTSLPQEEVKSEKIEPSAAKKAKLVADPKDKESTAEEEKAPTANAGATPSKAVPTIPFAAVKKSEGQEEKASASAKATEAASAGYHTEKIWTHAEVDPRKGADIGVLPHWPAGAEIWPGVWYNWLPADWSQILWATASGNKVAKFVSPSGQLVHNKEQAEKIHGRPLHNRPNWPEWLPENWHMTTMGGKPVYVNPDRTRFFRLQKDVERVVTGDPTYKPRPASLLKLPPS